MGDENKSRISLVCAPHDGSRSPAFLKFQRDFRTGTQAEFVKDDEYSVWQALNNIYQVDKMRMLQQCQVAMLWLLLNENDYVAKLSPTR